MSGKGQALVVVDPVSSGGNVAYEAWTRGYAVINVYCAELSEACRLTQPDVCKEIKWHATIEEQEGAPIAETAKAVKKACGSLPLAACIVGGESGVTLADALSHELGVVSNGIFAGGDRRNKSVQQKAVKAAGLRAVREALGKEWHEVESFVDSETFPLVLKPVESVGSDGVMLCHSKQEAKDHFKSLWRASARRARKALACSAKSSWPAPSTSSTTCRRMASTRL
jgi:hypothetical protein